MVGLGPLRAPLSPAPSSAGGERYMLVIAADLEEALTAIRARAAVAIGEKRLRVIPGDRSREFFPTAEARQWLRRFYNRARSSGDELDRVQRVAIVFFRFFPAGAGSDGGRAAAFQLAQEAGYSGEQIAVHRADSAAQLHQLIGTLGMGDPVAETEPETFCEALEQFAAEHPEDAVVSARALAGARDWEYPDPPTILRDLRAIHRIYGRWHDRNGVLISARDRKRHLEEETGLVLGYEDESTIKRYRTAVFPEMQGRKLTFPLHAKYNHEHTRIYFWFPPSDARDQERVKTLVAEAGAHLRTGSRNDKR